MSFDVVSLYANINIEEAVSTALKYGRKYNIHLCGLSFRDLNELLHLLLENNVFEYPGHGVYLQIRGLAMASRLSGMLAILAMDRFEKNNIYDTIRPVVYVRYVDDIGTVVSSIPEANQLLETLNSQHQTIKFELELPAEDNYLPLLDAALKINHDGSLSHRLHTKSASKQIILHYDSHHPDTMKMAIVKNELKRAKTNSSVDNVTRSTNTAITKLINNGYHADMINKQVERV